METNKQKQRRTFHEHDHDQRRHADLLQGLGPQERAQPIIFHHGWPLSADASDTEPARLLAVLIVDAADEPLVIPDPQ